MNAILRKQLARKSGKKGFTLVEVIVVIVIIAILAAIGVPALTGYIDKAHDRQIIADAHNLQIALQAIGVDAYNTTGGSAQLTATITTAWTGATTNDSGQSAYVPGMASTTIAAEVLKLAGKSYTPTSITGIKYTAVGALTDFIFKDGSYQVVYSSSAAKTYTVSKVS
jgi:type IV pilus assembly protein PilA